MYCFIDFTLYAYLINNNLKSNHLMISHSIAFFEIFILKILLLIEFIYVFTFIKFEVTKMNINTLR